MNERRSSYHIQKGRAIKKGTRRLDPKLIQQRRTIIRQVKTASISYDSSRLTEAYFKEKDPIIKREILKNISDDQFHKDLILDAKEDEIMIFTSLTLIQDKDFLWAVKTGMNDIDDPLLHAVLDYKLRRYKPKKNGKVNHYTFSALGGLFGASSETLNLGAPTDGETITLNALGDIGYTIDQIMDMTAAEREAAIVAGGGTYDSSGGSAPTESGSSYTGPPVLN